MVPRQPADGIVLTIGIVVTGLGSAELVACGQHRYALTKKKCREKVTSLSVPQGVDGLVVGLALLQFNPKSGCFFRRPNSLRHWLHYVSHCNGPNRSG